MGCDIHAYVEVKHGDKWRMAPVGVFDRRNYGLFGFLADVRNYSHVPPIAKPRDIPEDVSPCVGEHVESWAGDSHNHSWLSLKELLDFDYDEVFEDRRCTRQEGPNFWNGAADAGEGNGKRTRFREFLGQAYFEDLTKMGYEGSPENVRVVFWFDN